MEEGVGSCRWAGFVLRLEAEGADGDLGGVEVSRGVDGGDIAAEDSGGDTGNEVADVLVAGEVGHGFQVGVLGTIPGFGFTEIHGTAFQDGAVAGIAAALDGGGAD